jgi:steroid 5-alpha reductase family enzyme
MAFVMASLFLLQRFTRNAGVVDVGWAAGVGGLAVYYALMADGDETRRILLACMAGAWSLRLALYLLRDRVIGRPEDGRYIMLKNQWGPRAGPYLFGFFQMQAFWAVLFAIPFLPVAFHRAEGLTLFDMAGLAVFLIALAGETVADLQLARFRDRPENKGRTCRTGLWKYSRHPNYFFEWIHWFAYPLMALPSQGFWIALSGPVVMLLFLWKITGIPYTEKQALLSRGEDYRRYQASTSPFIPWFPRKENS